MSMLFRTSFSRHCAFGIAWVLGVVCWLFAEPARGQPAKGQPGDAPAELRAEREAIQRHIRDLSHPDYRTRQLARWRLEQRPAAAIDAVGEELADADYNTAVQLIELLSELAVHGDVNVSLRSRETLYEHAQRVTSTGRLAANAVQAISDLQEEQAIETLTHHGARIASYDSLDFNLNARTYSGNGFTLWINEDFTGDDESIEWIQFLKSVENVFLEGATIDSRHYRAVARLTGVKNLKLKHVQLSVDDLELFRGFTDLELLEINYVPIDDSCLTTLAKLPVSQSLRLYGTRVTSEGVAQLAQQLDGIDIYRGSCGYL